MTVYNTVLPFRNGNLQLLSLYNPLNILTIVLVYQMQKTTKSSYLILLNHKSET